MREVARIKLPPHRSEGDFDHAAVDSVGDRLYVAHPSNDAVEVVDLSARRHSATLTGLRGVAGVWVDPKSRLLFTSNRGEDTASIFRLEEGGAREVARVPTGARPNGMAFDPGRSVLLVAGVGVAGTPSSPPTLTFVTAHDGRRLGQVVVPGRTRWALYHRPSDAFYVNVADPPQVLSVPAGTLPALGRERAIPARGPHGLEQDPAGRFLYCACDEGVLVSLEIATGATRVAGSLSGAPDVLWTDPATSRLYCAVGDPGTVDVFDLASLRPVQSVPTAEGAHTLTVDPRRNEVHVFLPGTEEDLVLGEQSR